MPSLALKIPPPLVALLSALAMGALACWGLAPLGLPWSGRSVTAAALMAGAGAIFLSGGRQLLKAGTTWHPGDPSRTTSLVMGGFYRFSRNPIYLAGVAALGAWGLFLNDGLALSPLPGFVLYMTRFQIIPEEEALERLFGSQYLDYKRRVRRWL